MNTKSKPLGNDDSSGFEFAKEMLNGEPTFAINFDRLQYHPQKGYIIFEWLLCDEKQTVTPHSSHPNRYFHLNKHKFISLDKVKNDLNATLFLVNYAKKGTKHEDKIKLMKVLSVDEYADIKVQTEDWLLSRERFAAWFRKINRECS